MLNLVFPINRGQPTIYMLRGIIYFLNIDLILEYCSISNIMFFGTISFQFCLLGGCPNIFFCFPDSQKAGMLDIYFIA